MERFEIDPDPTIAKVIEVGEKVGYNLALNDIERALSYVYPGKEQLTRLEITEVINNLFKNL